MKNKRFTATRTHPIKRWEVSIIKFQNSVSKKFKVTRRLPEVSVAETKFFTSKKKARRLFDEWLK